MRVLPIIVRMGPEVFCCYLKLPEDGGANGFKVLPSLTNTVSNSSTRFQGCDPGSHVS